MAKINIFLSSVLLKKCDLALTVASCFGSTVSDIRIKLHSLALEASFCMLNNHMLDLRICAISHEPFAQLRPAEVTDCCTVRVETGSLM